MSSINNETINQLGDLQNQIWQHAQNAASLGFKVPVVFSSAISVAAKTQDVVAELPGPMLALQFAFQSRPADEQLLLLPPDFAKSVVSQVLGTEVEDLTEEVLESVKDAFRAIVEGICEGNSAISGEPESVASFTFQRQIVELPGNLQDLPEIVRVQISAAFGSLSGTLTLLFSGAVANTLVRANSLKIEESAPIEILERTTAELDVILDIPLQVSVELGRMSMLVQDVVELGTGSIVEIDKAAGDPVDVLVNGKLVARGEVVVIEDNFGVRITEILSPKERVHKLGEVA